MKCINKFLDRPTRKAANLAELQKYFKAASEAAQEVCLEQGHEAMGDVDLSKLTEGGPELNSPSRMLALQQANRNPLFREKLQIKLDTGSRYKVNDRRVSPKKSRPVISKDSKENGMAEHPPFFSTFRVFLSFHFFSLVFL